MELNQNKSFASGDLEGKVVDAWTVVSKLASPDRSKHETGGNFSTYKGLIYQTLIAYSIHFLQNFSL